MSNRRDRHRSHRSRSPPRKRRAYESSPPRERKRDKKEYSKDHPKRPKEEGSQYAWGKPEDSKQKPQNVDKDGKPIEKEKPNFEKSGKLTEDTNTFKGVVIKYNEPPEARRPKKRWRFYPFKGTESLPIMHLHRQSAYLLGRDRRVADIPIDHPSCSKQHAVLQFKLQPYTKPDGTKGSRVKPYIIDLESANGTFVNSARIESRRYVELFEKDVLKFGFSKRDYVILTDSTDTSDLAGEDDGMVANGDDLDP